MLNNIATIKTERIKNTSREIKDKRYILKETISNCLKNSNQAVPT